MDSLLPVLETDVEALKTLVRMVGLLPIELENFDRYYQLANSFAIEILRHIRPQFNRLFKSVNETEQVLFRNGLATLLCIELLNPAEDNSDDNKLVFLSQIPDIKQCQTIANEILLKLYEFNLPIYTNSTWTDLFTFIDPNMIKLQDIYIFDSFNSYITFITKASPLHPENDHFYTKVTEELPRLIYFDKFRSKILNKITNYSFISI